MTHMVPSPRRVTIEVNMNEPGLVPASFDLMRLLAKASDLPDIDRISICMILEVSGHAHDFRVAQLKSRLEQFWLGEVTANEVKPDGRL